MKEQLEKELEKIGLSEKEAKVYLASLELGPSTAQTIAAKATVNRPTTYIMIESLIKRGLMSSFEKGKKRYFAAAPPTSLFHLFDLDALILKEKKQNVEKILPLLIALSSTDEIPKVSLFEGKSGLVNVHRDMIATAKKTGAIDNIAAIDASRLITTQEEMEPLWDEIIKNNIRVRTIYTKSGSPQKYPHSKTVNWLARRLPSDRFVFNGEVSIYGDKVAALAFKKGEIGVILQSRDIADTLRVLFELAWATSENFSAK